MTLSGSSATSNTRSGEGKGYSRVQAFEISSALHSTSATGGDEYNEIDEFLDNDNFPTRSISIHYHTDRHMLFSLMFVGAMALSSFVSLICYIFMINVLLELTNRWYICGITAFLQFTEKIIIFLTLRRVRIMDEGSDPRRAFTIPVFTDEHHNQDDTHEEQHQPQQQQHRPRILFKQCSSWRSIRFFLELFVMAIISLCYIHYVPKFCKMFVSQFFVDPSLGDKSVPVFDWAHDGKMFRHIATLSKICGGLYLGSVCFGLVALYYARHGAKHGTSCDGDCSGTEPGYGRFNVNAGIVFRALRFFSIISCVATGLILLLAAISAWTYLVDHPLPKNHNVGPYCDPMDTHECLLPFPSSFFSVEDKTTETGIRVNIELDAVRSLYRGHMSSKHAPDLNGRDGFSTSGTIMFYLDGMKEADGKGFMNNIQLVGPEEIELSTTSQTMTLLLDMDAKELVPHFAEIDYYDEERPVVIIQSSKTLKRNGRYAVALIDAADVDGGKLPVSDYLTLLLNNESDAHHNLSLSEKSRGLYYRNEVIPTLSNAAPWISTDRIQIMFDFYTASENGQLGNTRKIIESTLGIVASDNWGGWGDHNIRVVQMVDYADTCIGDGYEIGRIIDIVVDVPDFMHGNTRTKVLNKEDLRLGKARNSAPFDVVIIVPCSVVSGSVAVSATVDYGHGFLGSRQELRSVGFLTKAANQNGYILFASNWRGLSFLDFPVIIKAFIANPNEINSITGNIMQGYANKAAVQHFVNNALFDMEFMTFNGSPVHISKDSPVRHLFYGISLGGIFGSSYTTLMARTNSQFLDGSILTSAGSPFSLLISRSAIFSYYEYLLKKNLHHKRHIRIFLSLMQMNFDAIDGPTVGLSGSRPDQRIKTLLQAGLGDHIVSTVAFEFMGRDYGASAFASNPRKIHGIQAMDSKSNVCVTEMMYTQPYAQLPKRNVVPSAGTSNVHGCTRSAEPLVLQLIEFINNGNFLDVCSDHECVLENPC